MRSPRLSSTLLLSVLAACGNDDALPFQPKPTVQSVGGDPLSGTGVESCPIYQDQRCKDGRLSQCEIYDAALARFVDAPDPLLRRVYLYDRWYDRYMSPSGLTMERVFNVATTADTPESEWGAPSRFLTWTGNGDAAIWTGAALVADTFRYVATRTEADYRRMEEKTRTLVRNFEVTNIPGYLARNHFLAVDEATPQSDQLILHHGEVTKPTQLPIENLDIPGLPAEYRDGSGKAYWDGDVSIDQYTGPMTAFPIVYNLLRDEALKARIVYHMTCYLNRLQRIEIRNLKTRPDLVMQVQSLFAGSSLHLDPDDPDIRDVNELIWFVHRGINKNNADHFDRTCPDGPPLAPGRIYDARSPTFESELLELATDTNRDIRTRETQIDHFYIVSLRGGDATHLLHLATMAYYFTGEEKYRIFLFDELIGRLHLDAVARTALAFRNPDWCESFYGDHITYGTLWQLITMLPDGALKDDMLRVMHEELWQKALFNHESAKFNTMYGGVVAEGDRERAIASAVQQLQDFGGNGGVIDGPRRTYSRDRASVIAALPAGITTRCPTAEQRSACEDGINIFGLQLAGESISHDCDGRAGECMMSDGKCTDPLASSGLPASLRGYSDFMWQRSPFELGETWNVEGQLQSPGRDLSEPYWLARFYGFIETGRDQVLAWRESGSCP